jgi:hypothetical protein
MDYLLWMNIKGIETSPGDREKCANNLLRVELACAIIVVQRSEKFAIVDKCA